MKNEDKKTEQTEDKKAEQTEDDKHYQWQLAEAKRMQMAIAGYAADKFNEYKSKGL